MANLNERFSVEKPLKNSNNQISPRCSKILPFPLPQSSVSLFSTYIQNFGAFLILYVEILSKIVFHFHKAFLRNNGRAAAEYTQ